MYRKDLCTTSLVPFRSIDRIVRVPRYGFTRSDLDASLLLGNALGSSFCSSAQRQHGSNEMKQPRFGGAVSVITLYL
jgi:hypothetical protein